MSGNPEQMHNDEQMYSSVAMSNSIRLDEPRIPIKISERGKKLLVLFVSLTRRYHVW